MNRRGRKPVVYLLCGFVASGKTTYSRHLEAQGCVRLSIDEVVYERHGRHGVHYPEHDYPAKAAEAQAVLDERLADLLAAGSDVVLDYGFWSPEMRRRYRELIETLGAEPRLIYLDVDLAEIRRRLAERNTEEHANALFVEERMLAEFLTRWHPPSGEDEIVVSSAS